MNPDFQYVMAVVSYFIMIVGALPFSVGIVKTAFVGFDDDACHKSLIGFVLMSGGLMLLMTAYSK